MYEKYIKRILDLFLALLLLIILLPLFIIISIIIKIDSRGPVLFSQNRTGKGGSTFSIIKFRTMNVNNNVSCFYKNDSPTKVGIFLRRTNLDELPQIINIIKGEMSFIGPRPWIPEYYNYFTKEQKRRCNLLPGITGLAQCNGKNNIPIFKKINYDLEYVDNISLLLDIKIFFKTFTILNRKDINSTKYNIKKELDELKNQNKEVKKSEKKK